MLFKILNCSYRFIPFIVFSLFVTFFQCRSVFAQAPGVNPAAPVTFSEDPAPASPSPAPASPKASGPNPSAPPLATGTGFQGGMVTQIGVAKAAAEMQNGKLQDAAARQNLNSANAAQTASDVQFESDVNSGNYNNEEEDKLRLAKAVLQLKTLNSLQQSLPQSTGNKGSSGNPPSTQTVPPGDNSQDGSQTSQEPAPMTTQVSISYPSAQTRNLPADQVTASEQVANPSQMMQPQSGQSSSAPDALSTMSPIGALVFSTQKGDEEATKISSAPSASPEKNNPQDSSKVSFNDANHNAQLVAVAAPNAGPQNSKANLVRGLVYSKIGEKLKKFGARAPAAKGKGVSGSKNDSADLPLVNDSRSFARVQGVGSTGEDENLDVRDRAVTPSEYGNLSEIRQRTIASKNEKDLRITKAKLSPRQSAAPLSHGEKIIALIIAIVLSLYGIYRVAFYQRKEPHRGSSSFPPALSKERQSQSTDRRRVG